MKDFEPSDVNQFATFEDFFIRKHRPGSRPIFEKDDPTKAVVVADCRLVVYPTVSETKALWIKGKNFTIANVIQDTELARTWYDGAVASFRLSPQDYHRYHSPVEGVVSWYKRIPGEYYRVDPLCLQSDVDILTLNARCCVAIDTRSSAKCFSSPLEQLMSEQSRSVKNVSNLKTRSIKETKSVCFSSEAQALLLPLKRAESNLTKISCLLGEYSLEKSVVTPGRRG